MGKVQLSAFIKKPYFLLGLILAAFLCREAFLAALFPLFTGQDEARHYNTIQWISEGRPDTCQEEALDSEQDKKNLGTYRFSEEIKNTSDAAGLSVWRQENYHKLPYTGNNQGMNESVITDNTWTKDIMTCPPDIVSKGKEFSLFHWIGSFIERTWGEQNVLVRFYLIRLLAVFFGSFTILLAYFAAKEAGFSSRMGLLIAFILSLQPKLLVYTTNINYDAILIPCFALFLYAGLHVLRRGVAFGSVALLILALGGAVLTKGTGLILLGGVFFLAGWTLLKKRAWWQSFTWRTWAFGGGILLVLLIAILNTYSLFNLLPDFSLQSSFEYLSKSLPRIPSSSENFWGVLSWNQAALGPVFVYLIWLLEILALVGLIRFFHQKEALLFLPSKPAVLFCLALILSLQLGVRLHDWHVYQETGALLLGTPGRYFLPTLLPQLLLIAVGLGTLLRKERFLERALLGLALLMLAFHLYTVWLIIIPRFYL